MTFFAPFCIPFMIGAAVMFIVLLWKWGLWLYRLPLADKKRILFGLPTRRTFSAIGEVVGESLLHRRIFRVNPLLGYMHMSLAFGWFLLIAVGWIETVAYLGFRYVPLQGHVFFKYFSTGLQHKPVFDFLMDLLLLFVLSGVALAWGKRFFSKRMGMRRTTKHVPGDRIALSALWFVFPARLIAESTTCALYGGGGFLTGSLGEWMSGHIGVMSLMNLETAALTILVIGRDPLSGRSLDVVDPERPLHRHLARHRTVAGVAALDLAVMTGAAVRADVDVSRSEFRSVPGPDFRR